MSCARRARASLGLITTLDTDAHNVYVILSARELNPNSSSWAANTLDAEEKLLRAGADRIVSPYVMAGHRLAEQAVRPAVVDYLDAALSHREPTLGLESLPVSPGSGLEGRSVGELRADGVVVLAIARVDDLHAPRYEASPGDDRRAAGESVSARGPAKKTAGRARAEGVWPRMHEPGTIHASGDGGRATGSRRRH
jgi:voltage-gated potassium channel